MLTIPLSHAYNLFMANDPRVTAADIRAARARVDESQAQFASRFGVDRSTVASWEKKGLPTKGTAPKLIEREILNIVNIGAPRLDRPNDVE